MRKYILLYVISIFSFFVLSAQKKGREVKKDTLTTSNTVKEKAITARDTLPPGEKYGLRIGVDLSKLIRTAVDEAYTGLELVGDYRFYKNFYAAGELGNESIEKDFVNINTTTKGSYIKLGFDYNAFKNWYGMQNSILVGLRYGGATFQQELNSYGISREIDTDTGELVFPVDVRTPESGDPRLGNFEGLTASWLEFVFGLKAEIAQTNIYMGINVSLKRKLSEKNPGTFKNLYIPGFGLTNDFSKFGVGYNYTITYFIPFYKKKR